MIRKGTFKHVESELFSYHDTLREITKIKAEIISGSRGPDENVGGGRSSLPSDPTGQTAVLLVTHKTLEHMERMVTAIDTVYAGLPEVQKKLVRLKYWTRPQTLTWDGVAHELHISRRQAFNWRDKIVQDIASKVGWK